MLFRSGNYYWCQKNLTPVYSKPNNSDRYLDGTSYHPTKSIDGILTGVAMQNKQMCAQMAMIFRAIKKIFRLIGCA